MEKFIEEALLYDFYGELLTEHQKLIYEDFVLNDLSLSESRKIVRSAGRACMTLSDAAGNSFRDMKRSFILLRNFIQYEGTRRRDQSLCERDS